MAHTRQLLRRNSLRSLVLTSLLALPLLGAGECANLTGSDSGSGSNKYDGSYELRSVDGQSLPVDLIRVDSRNRLVLTKGVWTLSGTTLSTAMYTTSIVNGVSTSEARFNPERHTGKVTFSGGTATGTLDTGSSVSTTFSTGTMLTTYNGRRMEFRKM